MAAAGPSENSPQPYHPTTLKKPSLEQHLPSKPESITFIFIAILQFVSSVQQWRSLCHPSKVHTGFRQHTVMCVIITLSKFMGPWISAEENEQVSYPKQVDVSQFTPVPQTFTSLSPLKKFVSQVNGEFCSFRHFPVICQKYIRFVRSPNLSPPPPFFKHISWTFNFFVPS
jgi:hypothetical protein